MAKGKCAEVKVSLEEEVETLKKHIWVIKEVLVANSDAIKRIDKEIVKIMKTKEVSLVAGDADKDNLENINEIENVNKMTKKLRQFNRGFCKYKKKCRFYHPEHICEDYLKSNNCEQKEDILKDVNGKKIKGVVEEMMDATTYM